MPRRTLLLLLLGALFLPSRAPGQVTPLTVPKGKLRIDFSGRFESFDLRWNDGLREDWAGDFNRDFGRSVVPGLAETEERLKRITGLSDVSMSLGRGRAAQLINLGTLGFGGAVGVTDWLTVFGTVPFVRVRARTRVSLDTTGVNAGFNRVDPVFGNGAAAWMSFRAALSTSLLALEDSLASGFYDPTPNLKTLAQQTVAQGRALELDLFDLFERTGSAATFLPVTGSPVANALLQTIRDLQTTLNESLSVGTSFTALPPLPLGGIGDAGLLDFLTNPEGPIAARPFDDVPELTFVGDVELGAVVSLFDHFPTSSYGRGARAALETTVRLRTAKLDSPERFLDLGTGDRQPDVELNLVADVGLGRFGSRFRAGYNLQMPGNQNRRIAAPGQIAAANTLAGIRRNPGDVIRLSAQPFARIAPYLSLGASFDYWRRGRDAFSYAAGQPPLEGLDIDILSTGTKSDALVVGLALVYTHSGVNRDGRQRLPMDARVRWHRVATSTVGRVADSHVLSIDLRFYGGLF